VLYRRCFSTLKYTKIEGNQEELELNATEQLLIYDKDTEILLDAIKEISLEVNSEKTIHVPSPD
jgi:hypothetical protein